MDEFTNISKPEERTPPLSTLARPASSSTPPQQTQEAAGRSVSSTTHPTTAAGDPAASTPAAPHLNPRSCTTCRRRKVRCNKHEPCANCVKAGIECIFPGPGRAPRKSRKPPDAELLSRLRRLEGVVNNLGAGAGAGVDGDAVAGLAALMGSKDVRARFGEQHHHQQTRAGESPGSDHDDSRRNSASVERKLGRLVISDDRSRYVSNTFWTAMSDEVCYGHLLLLGLICPPTNKLEWQITEMRDLLETSTSEDEEDFTLSPEPDQANHQAFIFGYSSAKVNLRQLHPTPSQTFILWEVFKENVDPVVRILHRPTARIILMNAASNLDRVSKPAEALLFSIYFGAVVSLSEDQCLQLLDEPKELLLKKYRFATEQALARANFLNSNSLICLQAFCFFLVFVRHCDDSRVIWSLGGLVIHLAQAIGIHRDGTNFDLNPFDTEMRRRLWWHISLLDSRSAEDHGTDPTFTEQFYDTKIPSNVNDEDIFPGMKEWPKERVGATEMTFCLIRFELGKFARENFFGLPNWPGRTPELTVEEKEKLIDDCHRELEEKYLRHCDMSIPIYWVTATVARLILAKIWLTLHHPRSFTSNSERSALSPATRERLFITSIEVIEFSHLLISNENTAKWGWLFQTYMQWQSVAFALSELCVRPPGPEVDRAWIAVESVYDERKEKPHRLQRGILWKPMRQLMAKARAKRKEQQIQLARPKDAFFTDLTSATPMERFIHDYPDNAITSTLEAFGMDLDNQPFFDGSNGPIQGQQDTTIAPANITAGASVNDIPRVANTSVDAGMVGVTGVSAMEQNASPATLTGDSGSLPNSDLLNYGWSSSLADTIGPQSFQKYFMNMQEEWF